MRVGLLTGGGDCPGLNAAIRAVVKHGIGEYGHSIIVVAEGAIPAAGTSMSYEAPLGPFGSIVAGAIGERVAAEIGTRTGFETRVTVLGHVQRGGAPTPTDRILGSRFGVAAMDAVSRGESGVMTALRGDEVVLIPLSDVAGKVKAVPAELLMVAHALA